MEKQVIFKDDAFTLEVEKDEYNNVRLIQFFKQGSHTDVDEILLHHEQQRALLEYLQNQLK